MKLKKNRKTRDWIVVRWMLILRPAIVTATLGMAILILPQEAINKTPIAIVVIGTYLLSLLYWTSHTFLGTSRTLLSLQIGFDIFLITVINIISNFAAGSYDSSFVGLYFLSIMCASLFFRRFITFLFSVQSIVFYVTALFVIGPLLDPDLLPESLRSSIMLQAIMYSALMLAVGFFSSYYSDRISKKDTALVSALNLLRKARLDTSDILQSMTNGLITVDTSGSIIYLNRAAKDILQIGSAKVEGNNYETVLRGRSDDFVLVLDHGLREKILPSEMEIKAYDKNGGIIPIGLTMVNLFDTDGSRRGIIVNFKDLTEKNKLLEMIRQSDRMAAIGELSAAIAHEIKNPLASICSAIEILAGSIDTKDLHAPKLLEIIEKESARLQRISADFLNFTRIKTPQAENVELRGLVDNVLELIDNDPRKTENVVIKNSIDENTIVMFDKDQLKQIVLNLLINSLDALEGKGEIGLVLDKGKRYDNRYVRLHVIDNGPGFPEEALGRMFEPFFSTKSAGTGLGLAIVRKMTIGNNGRIFAQNRLNGGAEVSLDILLKGDN